MKLLYEKSLGETVDTLNESLFFGKIIQAEQKKAIANWLASRQGLEGSYAGMISPTPHDFKHGIRVFTGEPMRTKAGTSHILGEESSRLLIKLDVKNRLITDALKKSNQGFEGAIERSLAMGNTEGRYCCGTCTAAYWRNLAAGGLVRQEKRLALGMKYLNFRRDGKGRWRSMPFYYTLLALVDVDSPSAIKELQYTARGLEKLLKRFRIMNPALRNQKYERRRRELVERVLAMV